MQIINTSIKLSMSLSNFIVLLHFLYFTANHKFLLSTINFQYLFLPFHSEQVIPLATSQEHQDKIKPIR